MDWTQVIQKLIDSGLTQTAIATRCGISQSLVSDLASGRVRQPAYDKGASLMALMVRVRRKQRRVTQQPSAVSLPPAAPAQRRRQQRSA